MSNEPREACTSDEGEGISLGPLIFIFMGETNEYKNPKDVLNERLSTLLDFEEPKKGQFLRIITDNFSADARTLLEKNGFTIIEIKNISDLLDEQVTQLFVKAQNISEQDSKVDSAKQPIKVAIIIPPNIRDAAISENPQFRDLWMITKQYGHIIDERF